MNKEEKIKAQQELIKLLYSQVVDLSMMSKIELGDDVIAEIKRLKSVLNEEDPSDWDATLQDGLEQAPWEESTLVFEGETKWGRTAYLKLVNDRIVFDCSDEEYGPIEFKLELFTKALQKHQETERYRELENAIIAWSNDDTKTAGELTRSILQILKP